MTLLEKDTKIEAILKKLEPDFNSLGIVDEDIRRSIAYELDTFANLLLGSYSGDKNKQHKFLSKKSIINKNKFKQKFL